MTNVYQKLQSDLSGLIGSVDIYTFDYSCHISLANRFLYYEIPKTGCSTIKATLQRVELRRENFQHSNLEDVHLRELSPLLAARQVGRFEEFLNRRCIFKFTFVRNPFTRTLSAYLDKIVGSHPHKVGILRKLGRTTDELTAQVSFEEFVYAISMQSISEMSNHWMPQWNHTLEGRMRFDFVGRFENFQTDLERVALRIGFRLRKYQQNMQTHQTSAEGALSAYYTPALQEVVYKIYEQDFHQFSYPEALPIPTHGNAVLSRKRWFTSIRYRA